MIRVFYIFGKFNLYVGAKEQIKMSYEQITFEFHTCLERVAHGGDPQDRARSLNQQRQKL